MKNEKIRKLLLLVATVLILAVIGLILAHLWEWIFPPDEEISLTELRAYDIDAEKAKGVDWYIWMENRSYAEITNTAADKSSGMQRFKFDVESATNSAPSRIYRKGNRTKFYNIGANSNSRRISVKNSGSRWTVTEKADSVVRKVKPTGRKFALLITIEYEDNGEDADWKRPGKPDPRWFIDSAQPSAEISVKAQKEGPGKNPHLPGTKHDGKMMLEYLGGKGFKVTHMSDVIYPSGHSLYPSLYNIKSQISNFVSGKKAGDVLWFQFSGHGMRVKRENDFWGGKYPKQCMICPADALNNGKARTDMCVTDDWMYKNFSCQIPAGVETIAIVDTCHAGGMIPLPFYYKDGKMTEHQQHGAKRLCKGVDITFISSCRARQVSHDTKQKGGVFTKTLLREIKRDKDITLEKLLKGLRRSNHGHGMTPQLASSIKLNPRVHRFSDCVGGRSSETVKLKLSGS